MLQVGADRTINVNGAVLPLDEVAADSVPYGFALEVMDQAREGGAVTIVTLTIPLGAAPTTALIVVTTP